MLLPAVCEPPQGRTFHYRVTEDFADFPTSPQFDPPAQQPESMVHSGQRQSGIGEKRLHQRRSITE